jgi:hypothetical protein
VQYACLIYDPVDSRPPSPEEKQQVFGEYMKFSEDVQKAGVIRGGAPLQPTDTATTVRVRKGERLTTDGPFAETKEWLAGFYLLECNNLDEALAWAAKIPGAKYGSIEVRPLLDIPGM